MTGPPILLLTDGAAVDQLPYKLSSLDQPVPGSEFGKCLLDPVVEHTYMSIGHNQPGEVMVPIQKYRVLG